MGVEIVFPEVYGIHMETAEVQNLASLQGEDLTQTWGIQQYQTYKYFENISERSKKIRV